jgi:hypothetical protein
VQLLPVAASSRELIEWIGFRFCQWHGMLLPRATATSDAAQQIGESH